MRALQLLPAWHTYHLQSHQVPGCTYTSARVQQLFWLARVWCACQLIGISAAAYLVTEQIAPVVFGLSPDCLMLSSSSGGGMALPDAPAGASVHCYLHCGLAACHDGLHASTLHVSSWCQM